MKFKLALLSLIGFMVASCEQPLESKFAYWLYMTHVDEYNTLQGTIEERIDTPLARQKTLHELTSGMIRTVEDIEKALLDSASQADLRATGRDGVPDMTILLSYTVSTSILIGKEPASPSEGVHSAERLRKQLNDHITVFAQASGIDSTLLQTLIRTDDIRSPDGTLNWWSTGTFYHMPLISVLDELNRIKMKLLDMEVMAIASEPPSLSQLYTCLR